MALFPKGVSFKIYDALLLSQSEYLSDSLCKKSHIRAENLVRTYQKYSKYSTLRDEWHLQFHWPFRFGRLIDFINGLKNNFTLLNRQLEIIKSKFYIVPKEMTTFFKVIGLWWQENLTGNVQKTKVNWQLCKPISVKSSSKDVCGMGWELA